MHPIFLDSDPTLILCFVGYVIALGMVWLPMTDHVDSSSSSSSSSSTSNDAGSRSASESDASALAQSVGNPIRGGFSDRTIHLDDRGLSINDETSNQLYVPVPGVSDSGTASAGARGSASSSGDAVSASKPPALFRSSSEEYFSTLDPTPVTFRPQPQSTRSQRVAFASAASASAGAAAASSASSASGQAAPAK
jgi:hypothetical protein